MDFSAESQTSSEEKPEAAAGEGQASAAPPNAPAIPSSVTRASDAIETPKDADKPKNVEPPKVPPIPSSALVILPPSADRFDAKKSAAAAETAVKVKRKSGWRTTASRAAIALIVFGGAFAAGAHFLGVSTPAGHTASADATPVQVAQSAQDSDVAEMRRDTKALGDEIHSLEARLQSLRASVQAQTPDELRGLKKSIDGLKASLDAEKTASDASIAQLSAKIDRLERGGKITETSLDRSERTDTKAIQQTLDRAARTERASAEPQTTGSIPGGSQVLGSKPQQLALAAEPQKRTPQLLTNWIVRDVYDGIALVEGPEGAVEVMPGDIIPGAGTVRSIQRRGNGWVVLTSRGMVDYDHD
jgi:hypothetical protein